MIALVREPIDPQGFAASPVCPGDGAVVVFLGKVRDQARGRRVLSLEYHAYEPMALRKLQEIAEAARKQYEITDLSILHRLGPLELSECSVAIAVRAPHRAAAFDACRYAIDTIKKVVPIWKKEFYEDGSCWIEGNGTNPS